MAMNKVKNVIIPDFSLLNLVNMTLNKPLVLPMEMAINDIMINTNGSNALKLFTGDDKK